MINPDVSVGVIIAVVIGAIIIFAIYLTAYCICNRDDFFDEGECKYIELDDHDSKTFQSEVQPIPETEYKSIGLNDHDSKTCQSEIQPLLAGLENFNQESFMNSIVQALASSKKIYDQLKEVRSHVPFCKSLKILQELIDGLNDDSPYKSVENNTSLLRALVIEIKWTVKPEQDAYEFLSAIINDIQKEIIDAKVQMNAPLKFNLKYKYCGVNIPDGIQTNLGLSLELCGEYQNKPGVPLDFLIKKYFSKILIDDDPTKTLQLFMIKNCPSVLVLHIQANKWNQSPQKMVKQNYFIKYGEYLNLDLDLLDFDNNEVSKDNAQYKLTAVVNHTENHSTDHYVTYRQFADYWLLANDTKIDHFSFNCNVSPYILIYEKLS